MNNLLIHTGMFIKPPPQMYFSSPVLIRFPFVEATELAVNDSEDFYIFERRASRAIKTQKHLKKSVQYSNSF